MLYGAGGKVNALDRFLKYVLPEPNTGCWLWIGTMGRFYGRFFYEGKRVAAHRFAFLNFIGPIPEELELDHTCKVKICVNPSHLEPVTHAVNLERADFSAIVLQRNKTHCPQGHEYNDVNSRKALNGDRICRVCDRERRRLERIAC